MSYLDIDNLYKSQEILMFKSCYAMEKIHGTSAHISFRREKIMYFGPPRGENQPEFDYKVILFSGGEKHENFIKLFNEQALVDKFREIGVSEMVVFGEAYGGKCQGMSHTYGKELKFIAFEVKIENNWLSVPQAHEICHQLGLDFVYYEETNTDIDTLNKLSEADSVQAMRNGIGPGHLREGIVLRPLIELRKNNGERIIAKHKNERFQETKKKREVSPDKLAVLAEANAIAEEWCTEMRLSHILDTFPNAGIEQTGDVIKAMIADIIKESKDEIVDSKDARTAIGKRAAMLFKARLKSNLNTKEGV